MLQLSEADLVQRLRRGDEAAFHEVLGRYSGELFGLAYSLLGNAADAEDVVQQVFLGALRRIHAFEGRASVKTWLVSILVNQASKVRRSQRVRRTLSLDDRSSAAASGEGCPLTRAASAASDSRFDVATMLAALPPGYRDVLVLRELHRMSYDEIARALRVPRGTVESRLFRARRALRARFEEYLG